MCAKMEGQRKITQYVHMRTATEAATTQNKDGLELLQARVKLVEASAARCSHTHTRVKLVEGGRFISKVFHRPKRSEAPAHECRDVGQLACLFGLRKDAGARRHGR
jgi:hypothetical protein